MIMTMKKDLPLPLHELLDRFEILYPDISELSDLRRAVVDHDISSIFRLSDGDEELRKAIIDENLFSVFRSIQEKPTNDIQELYEHIEALRKSVINKNLRSIFKLLKNDDLRKLITEDNVWKLWGILEQYADTQFIAAFKYFFVNDIIIDKDCFSRGQLESKLWLVKELKNQKIELGTVFLCAGWYATLATMLFESGIPINKIRSFDIDDNCRSISETFNKPWVKKDWKFKSCTQDIHDIDFKTHRYIVKRSDGSQCELNDSPDTIINTSCEHIKNFTDWYAKIPDGKLVVLQSNNYFEIEEHVNCVNNIYEFKEMAPMTTLMYMGMRELPKYTRFMLIGYK